MNEEKEKQSVRDTAIEWLMRRHDDQSSRKEQDAFEAWLVADSANRIAYDEISQIYDRLTAIDFGVPSPRAGNRIVVTTLSFIVASLLVAFVFFEDLSLFLRSDYYSGPGEIKLLTLEDGSRVQLDSRSAIALRYSSGERRLVLLEGQAWFDVAPEATRPFIVEAADGSATALGTAFGVDLDKGRVSVTVETHRVAVASGGRTVVVSEGEQSVYARGAAAQPPHPIDLSLATSWRNGALMFENATLGEVVTALGRYHRGRVFFADERLRSRRVTGVFSANDPLEALREIEVALGLHMAALTRYLVVFYD